MEEPKFEQVPEETAGAPAEPAALPAADEALIPEMPEEPAAPAEDPMVEVCDVQFRSGSKVYFFAPGGLKIATGDEVILETARGPEFGQCVRGNHMVHPREVTPPLRPILRLATQQDKRVHAENCRREKRPHRCSGRRRSGCRGCRPADFRSSRPWPEFWRRSSCRCRACP